MSDADVEEGEEDQRLKEEQAIEAEAYVALVSEAKQNDVLWGMAIAEAQRERALRVQYAALEMVIKKDCESVPKSLRAFLFNAVVRSLLAFCRVLSRILF